MLLSQVPLACPVTFSLCFQVDYTKGEWLGTPEYLGLGNSLYRSSIGFFPSLLFIRKLERRKNRNKMKLGQTGFTFQPLG